MGSFDQPLRCGGIRRRVAASAGDGAGGATGPHGAPAGVCRRPRHLRLDDPASAKCRPTTRHRAASHWLLDHADQIRDRVTGRPLALLLDFDGTLAPIAPSPELAVLSDP